MTSAAIQSIYFPPYTLDPAERCLWRDGQRLPLTPKDYAVLLCLITHAEQLVTQEALLQAGWPTEVVEPGVLKVRMRRLRQLLGDTADAPRFIESVRGYGYRFIAQVATNDAGNEQTAVSSSGSQLALSTHSEIPHLVGREAELLYLHSLLENAASGARQVLFVTGEPGIGKTTLIDAFIASVQYSFPLLRIARGQCIEHHGVSEAYLPVLEALGRLCRKADGEVLLPIFRQLAPTWLVQMPALLDDAELESLQRKVLGSAQRRMMRELAEALEALSVDQPLLLWLEDVQWADYSTLDLICYLAQRRDVSRLLIIGTYRQTDVNVPSHPLRAIKQELQMHRQCKEIPLRFLREHEVSEYLALRFAVDTQHPGSLHEVARIIHQTTEGNPLFMVNMTDDLVIRENSGVADGQWQVRVRREDVETGVPDSLRQLIEKQIQRFNQDEQHVLEVGSVIGVEFSAAAVAAGLAQPIALVEEQCEAMVRRGLFLRSRTTECLPDGTLTGRYGFLHAMYQKVFYERQAMVERARLHRRIGEYAEAVYGARAGELAAELATHFEHGHDFQRAVHYLGVAAQNALRRSANREAIDLLNRGIAHIPQLPETHERAEHELVLQATLAVPLMMTKGNTSLEVRNAYRRARELCDQVGDNPMLFPVLVGLNRFSYGWQSEDSRKLKQQLIKVAQSADDPSHLLVAHMLRSGSSFFQGDFALAHTHAQQGLELYQPQQHRALIFLYGDDPQVLCLCWAALAQWYLGYPDQARTSIARALQTALDLAHPYGEVFARFWTAFLHQAWGEVTEVQVQAEALLTVTRAHEIPQFAAMGTIVHGWAAAALGDQTAGITEMRQGIDDLRATRQELGRPYFSALLAQTYSACGQVAEGIAVVTEALESTLKTGECMHQSELYRLHGELLLQAPQRSRPSPGATGVRPVTAQRQSQAAACFCTAMEVANRQQAKSLALRAAMSLVRLRRQQALHRASGSRKHEAREMLAESRRLLAQTYNWFTEGSVTTDLQAAKMLLHH